MTDFNKQNIDIEVEADASAATRAAGAVADELGRVVQNVGQLEGKLRAILTGKLPQEMEKLASYVQILKTAEGLPANMGILSRQARTLASGGPRAQFDRAAFQGALAGLQNDKAVQALRYEKEANKVLEARQQIFQRIRGTVGDESVTMPYVAKAYREALAQLGEAPPGDGSARKAWMTRTLNEAKLFEQRMGEVRVQEAAKVNTAYERVMRRSYGSLFKIDDPTERDRQAQAMIGRIERLAARRGQTVDRGALNVAYEDAMEQRLAARVVTPPPPAKPLKVETPADRQLKAQQGYQNTQDRFAAYGGAGMFGVQAAVLRNYATMGAVLGTVGYAAQSTVEFQTALKDVQAIAKATDSEMKELRGTILDVGNSTKFSIDQISEGTKILAQAGYSVQQIQGMIKPISDLATGSGSDFAKSVATVTSVLSVFDMSITRTGEVSNVLVAGLNQSKLGMEQLSLGIQYAGNIAADGGVQFEELVAALGAMANAGIKSGSTMGTGMRALIADLENPSKKLIAWLSNVGLTVEDVNLRTHSLGAVLETLKTHGYDSAAAMGTLELRAAAAYSALSNNQDVYEKMLTGIQGTVSATEAATTQMDSFAAQWQRLTNGVTGFTTVVGAPLLSALQMATGGLADVLFALTSIAPALQIVITLLASLAVAAAGKWVLGFAAGLLQISGLMTGWGAVAFGAALQAKNFSGAVTLLGASIATAGKAMLASPLGWFALGLTAVVTVLSQYQSQQASLNAEIDAYATKVHKATAEGEEYQSRAKEIDKYIQLLIAHHGSLGEVTQQTIETAKSKFGEWGLTIDGTITRVDQLIGKMVELRGQMAQAAMDQAVIAQGGLVQQNGALEKKMQASSQHLGLNLFGGMGGMGAWMNRSGLKKSGAWDVMSELTALTVGGEGKSGGRSLTADEVNSAYSRLVQARSKATGGARDQIDRALKMLDPMRVDASNQRQNAQQISALGTTISQQSVNRSNGAAWATNLGISSMTEYQTERAAVDKLAKTDPRAALAQLQALNQKWGGRVSDIRGQVSGWAAQMAANPQMASGFEERAKANKSTVQTEIEKHLFGTNPALQQLDVLDKKPSDANTVAVSESLGRRLRKDAALAKKAGQMDQFKSLSEQAQEAENKTKLLKALQSGNFEGMEPVLANDDAGNQSDIARGMMSGGGGAGGDSAGRRRAASQAKSLERQIEVVSGNLGPGAAEMEAGQGQLRALLDDWKKAKQAGIRAGGGDVQSQLADFEDEAQKYFDEVLNGNIQAAKDLLAKRAAENASSTTATMAEMVRTGGLVLDDGLAVVMTSFTDAAEKAIEASDQEFRAKGMDPSVAHDAVERRRDITRDFVTRSLDAALEVLQAQADKVAADIRAKQLVIDNKRADIAALSNFYGTRNISDVQRYLGGVAGQKLDIDEARLDRDSGAAAYGQAENGRRLAQAALDQDPSNGDLQRRLAEATKNAEEMQAAFQRAEFNLRAMTAEVSPFQSATEAVSASWQAYADQAGMNRPMFEQLADGMTGVFDRTRTSFQTLVTDVASGSTTMGGAFKNFTLSILDSMLSLAADMLASKAIMWVVQMIGGAMGGGGGGLASSWGSMVNRGASLTAAGFQAGGEVRRMALGGGIPNRDSVRALLEPGEVVMRKSAVDFIGLENLLQMNAAGNRRMSAMPSVQQIQREPDTANVWVVAPETKPQVGRKDVVAIITEDMLTGGKTKQLIKAIQMGAA